MLPIAKAGVLLVLIGAGVTATYAVTNGGFGNGAGSVDNTQKTTESTAASTKPEVNPDASDPSKQPGASKSQSVEQVEAPTPENTHSNPPKHKVEGGAEEHVASEDTTTNQNEGGKSVQEPGSSTE